jgi:hypothetical protein
MHASRASTKRAGWVCCQAFEIDKCTIPPFKTDLVEKGLKHSAIDQHVLLLRE